jgi:hypothetical protein
MGFTAKVNLMSSVTFARKDLHHGIIYVAKDAFVVNTKIYPEQRFHICDIYLLNTMKPSSVIFSD